MASRVAALKALCEMRLDKDDLRGAIDAAAGPRRRLKKGEVDDSATLDDFRRAPLGRDAAGRAYWLHDFFDTTGDPTRTRRWHLTDATLHLLLPAATGGVSMSAVAC